VDEGAAVAVRGVVLALRCPGVVPRKGVMTSLLLLTEDDKGSVLVALVDHLWVVRGGR